MASSYMNQLTPSDGKGPSSANLGAGSGERMRIDYKMFHELMSYLYEMSKSLRAASVPGHADGGREFYSMNKMGIWSYLQKGVDWEHRAGDALAALGDAFNYIRFETSVNEDHVKSAVYDWDAWSTAIAATELTHATTSFASEYYPAFAEEQTRIKTEQDKKDADDAEAAAKKAAFLAWLAQAYPEVFAQYQAKLAEAEENAWLESLKNSDDPEDRAMYEAIMAAREARKKAEEEAAKAAEEAAAAFGGGSGLEDSGIGGSGFGGSDFGGSDFGGSDFGGSDFGGSDWASEDWGSDLLGDSIDADELLDAGAALDDIAGGSLADAVSSGTAAAADAADLGEGASGLFGKYGPQITEAMQRYGVQAGLALGGAVALYATREQTTEAVAHVAEFVTTKCKPAMTDVMDQVGDVAKKTRVKLDGARSGMVAAARGERVGDLVG